MALPWYAETMHCCVMHYSVILCNGRKNALLCNVGSMLWYGKNNVVKWQGKCIEMVGINIAFKMPYCVGCKMQWYGRKKGMDCC